MVKENSSDRDWLQKLWYEKSPWRFVLFPLSVIFSALVALRRNLYSRGVLKSHRVPVPVVVVGNISVGGTGKTPISIWLAIELQVRDHKPAIVSRGYGGVVGPKPVKVTAESDPDQVGDEAVLMAIRSRCPVFVHPDRVAAARAAVESGADLVIADDGLQHYRLVRDFEIAVMDGVRGTGNGLMLPAGPLREPVQRLKEVDRVLVQTEGQDVDVPYLRRLSDRNSSAFSLLPKHMRELNGKRTRSLGDFSGKPVHAVAAIGNPRRFFRMLESHGMRVIPRAYRDHLKLTAQHLDFGDELPIIMTEKDAVKCAGLTVRNCWYVPVTVKFPNAGRSNWLEDLHRFLEKRKAELCPGNHSSS
ncbi:MAG: tetraacyldisaccharide 4'-kinase [Gammaproteobacteria bacterium]|nr:tetraacyldisaccharide 4'-kinase [Gammaproteobacteria bacterium]MDH4313503.1 tetraacyldisaccharide 4'-kinase [Gammaproteobacteria bacterium]MDH5213883.1 tetraacyldisaccharide 4'-kinase [Gammaproteobacteria bacterium]MDH5500829.1 tetraacyldisaccharide 4'-kinase [Gammaproteobacteria bacterium]